MTLLSLYAASDTVLIGRYDKREEFGTNRVGNGFTIVSIRTSFDVSTVIKGEPRKFAAVESEEFRYQVTGTNGIPRDAVFVDDIESRRDDAEPRPGDAVLVFLKQDGDTSVLTDERDGVRRLSGGEQAVYEARLKELNAIFDAEKPRSAKLAEWLVRCVEDRSTRWDGVHELLQGSRRIDWQRNAGPNGYERIDPSVSSVFGPDAVKALTAELKDRLTQVLISAAVREPSAKEISDGDRELITLVKTWDPDAAARAMLALLKSGGFSRHFNAGLMYRIAELLDDQESGRLQKIYAGLRKDQNALDPNDKVSTDLDRVLARFIRTAEIEIARRADAPAQ